MNFEPAHPRRYGCCLTRAPRIRHIVDAGRIPEGIKKIVVTVIEDDEIWMILVQLGLEPDQILVHGVGRYTGIDDLDSPTRKAIVEYSLKSCRPGRGVC